MAQKGRFNGLSHFGKSNLLSKKQKVLRQRLKGGSALLALLGIILLFAFPSITKAIPLSDGDQFDRVWRMAQNVGSYEFEADVLQTTLPTLSLENLGQTPQRSRTTANGSVDSATELVTFAVDTQQGLLEFRVDEGVAYGRQYLGPDTPWVRMDGAPSLFAPGNDVQGYAAAATNVVKVENWREVETLDAVTQVQVEAASEMFRFTVDGNKLAEIVKAQQEEELIKNGALAPGQELGLPAEFQQVNGSGRLWIDENGLPLYQILDLNLPAQSDKIGQTEIEMHTLYSGWEASSASATVWGSAARFYDNPSILISDPVSLVPNAQTLTPQALHSVGMMIGLIILTAAAVLLLFYFLLQSRTRHIQTAIAGTMIFAMVGTPFMQVGSLYAYSGRMESFHSSSNGSADLLSNEPSAAETIHEEFTPEESEAFDPLTDPLTAEADAPDLALDAEPIAAAADIPVAAVSAAVGQQVCDLADTGADCDGDGLSNGTEVLRLGTDPESVDTDGDLISDGREVAGVSINGQMWYLDPNNPDSNQDEYADSIECPTMIDIDKDGAIITDPTAPFSGCTDDDGDGVPNAFDFDNDGDGVHDVIDSSPFFNEVVSSDLQDYVGLTVENYDVGESLLVEYQVRPSDLDMLWHNGRTINWGEDMRGQITKVVDQEMYLTPYLEISIPYPGGNSSNVVGSLPISPTINYADVEDDYLSGAVGGGGSQPFITDWLNSGYLKKHGINVYQDDEGITGNPSDDKLTALIPLVDVLDPVGGSPIAWSGVMLYQPQVAEWGLEHEVRLVWYLSGYNDYCDTRGYNEDDYSSEAAYCRDAANWKTYSDPTVFVDYEDQFTVSGVRVSEYESVKTAAIVQTDALNPAAGYEEDIWRLGDGLTQSFIAGTVITNSTGTYTTDDRFDITDVKNRFDNEGADPFADGDEELWGIANGQLDIVLNTDLDDNIMGLEQLIAVREALLSTNFSSQAAISDTVSVLFLREESARYANLNSETTTVSGSSVTIDMTNMDDTVTAIMNVFPYEYAGVNAEQAWVPTDMATYVVTELEPTLRSLTTEDDLEVLATNGEVVNDAEGIAVAYAIFASNFYMKLYDGFSGMVESGGELVYETTGPVDEYALLDSSILLNIEIPAFLSLADNIATLIISILDFSSKIDLGNETIANRTVTIPDKFEFAEIVTVEDRVKALTDPETDSNIALIEKADIFITQLQLIILDYDKFTKWFKAAEIDGPSTNQRLYRDAGHIGMAVGAGIRLAGPALGLDPVAVTVVALSFELPGAFKSAYDSVQTLKYLRGLDNVDDLFNFGRFQAKTASKIKAIKSATKFSIVFGFVLSTAVIIGMTAYAIAANDVKPGSIEFNFLITKGAIAIAVEVIFLVLALAIPVGTIIFIVIQLIDLIAAAFCEIYEASEGDGSLSDDFQTWFCGGITGALTEALTFLIYDNWLTVDTGAEDRLEITFNDPRIITGDGFKAGAEIELGFTITSTITLNDLEEGVIKNSAGTLDLPEIMRESTYDYFLQTDKLDQHDSLGFGETNWTAKGSQEEKAVETFIRTQVFSFNEPGQNLTPAEELYLTESFNIVNYECWGFIGTSRATCKKHPVRGSSHIPVDKVYFDIFPAEINDFYGETRGSNIRWIQGSGAFSPFQDADGDGLLPFSGGDPDNRSADMDDDGLSDAWEIDNGTDPRVADRDNDGLSDYWEIFYDTNPYRADTDGDGLLDGEEFFRSQTNYPWQAETEPWTGGWTIIYDVDGNGDDLVIQVSADPTVIDTDDDGMIDTDERFFNYNPTVLSKLNPLAVEGEIKTNSLQSGIVGLGDSVAFTATVENQDTFFNSLSANLDVEIPTGSLQSTTPLGTLNFGESATVSDEAGVGTVGASAYTSVTLRAEGIFLDDLGNVPANISQTPLVNFGFNEPQGAGQFANEGSLGGSATCNIAQGNGNEGCPFSGAPGKNGNAIYLDAQRQQIDYSNAGLPTDSYSVGFWYNQASHSRNADMFTWGSHVVTVQGAAASGFGRDVIQWRFAEDSGGACANNLELITNDDIEDGRWIHVMFTHDYDGVNSNLGLYVNGELKESSSTPTSGSCQIGMNAFNIYAGFGNARLHALVDDFQIYDSALSGTDVETLYTYQFAQFDTAKQYPITIDATGPEAALVSNVDITNDMTVLGVTVVDDLSAVEGVTITVTAPDTSIDVIVPEREDED
ncbi:MAG: LamG-like jellyroll fold domain-containing protein, partial [Chloroflexota bacterium]